MLKGQAEPNLVSTSMPISLSSPVGRIPPALMMTASFGIRETHVSVHDFDVVLADPADIRFEQHAHTRPSSGSLDSEAIVFFGAGKCLGAVGECNLGSCRHRARMSLRLWSGQSPSALAAGAKEKICSCTSNKFAGICAQARVWHGCPWKPLEDLPADSWHGKS